MPERRGVDLQGAGVSDKAIQAALTAWNHYTYRATTDRVPAMGAAVEAAVPFIRAPLEAENERLRSDLHALRARTDESAPILRLMRERDEARDQAIRDVVEALRAAPEMKTTTRRDPLHVAAYHIEHLLRDGKL